MTQTTALTPVTYELRGTAAYSAHGADRFPGL